MQCICLATGRDTVDCNAVAWLQHDESGMRQGMSGSASTMRCEIA